MSQVCISTVCSADDFQYYIPLFVYSIAKAYPECHAKVFLRGKMNQTVKDCLDAVPEKNFTIHEDAFMDYPTRESTCNTLRHLVPAKYYEGFKYIFVCDVDFIFVRQHEPFYEYFTNRLIKTKQSYASFRGPYKQPYRPEINLDGWTGAFTRIADGTLFLKNPQWFEKTHKARKYYKKRVRYGKVDGFDGHTPCSYREYNEVMLYRIVRQAGLKAPWKKDKFTDGVKFDYTYRQIHLGDFKFDNRYPVAKKMKKYLKPHNFNAFLALERDLMWQRICEAVGEKCLPIRRHLRRLRKYGKAVMP